MKLTLLLLLALELTPSPARAYPPYHDISDTAAAQAEANERKLPIAYLGTFPEFLTAAPSTSMNADLTQLALTVLEGNAVIITFDGHDMGAVPMMIHMQYHQPDDGTLKDGAAWIVPKIVFADPGITKTLGRVSHSQMRDERGTPIVSALNVIKNDLSALTPRPKPARPIGAPPADSDGSETPDSPQFGTLAWATNLLQSRWQYFAAGLGILILALFAKAARRS